jgi:hypothetical protein
MDLQGEGRVRKGVDAEHESFFVPLWVFLLGLAMNMCPKSQATFVEKMSTSVKGPGFNLSIQSTLA